MNSLWYTPDLPTAVVVIVVGTVVGTGVGAGVGTGVVKGVVRGVVTFGTRSSSVDISTVLISGDAVVRM